MLPRQSLWYSSWKKEMGETIPRKMALYLTNMGPVYSRPARNSSSPTWEWNTVSFSFANASWREKVDRGNGLRQRCDWQPAMSFSSRGHSMIPRACRLCSVGSVQKNHSISERVVVP